MSPKRRSPSPDLEFNREPFPDIIGHDRNLTALRAYCTREHRSGVLLFAGPDGVGKKLVALRFAMGLLCERGEFLGCQACPSCRLVLAEQHPDLRLAQPPAGKKHPLDSVHAFQEWLAFRPWRGERKIWIWDEAEKMRTEAANALLKSLEEPPPDTLVLLVTGQLYRVLPTIRSRAQIHRFGLIREDTLIRALLTRTGCAEREARWIARMSEGRPGLALRPDPYWPFHRELRRRVLEWLHAWLTDPLDGWTAFMDLDLRDLAPMAEEITPQPGRLYYADSWVWSRWWVEQVLQHGIALLRDLFYLSCGLPEAMRSFDLRPMMERLARDLPPGWLMQKIAQWSEFVGEMKIYNFNGVWHIPALLYPPPRF